MHENAKTTMSMRAEQDRVRDAHRSTTLIFVCQVWRNKSLPYRWSAPSPSSADSKDGVSFTREPVEVALAGAAGSARGGRNHEPPHRVD